MAEEDLKKAILEKIQEEKENILNQARKEEERIFEQAKIEARVLRERYLEELKKRCLLKKTRELNRINLDAQKQLLEAKERKILKVFSLVEENLKAIHQDREHYKSIFRHLLEESWESLDKDKDVKLKLKVNPQDRELALDSLKKLKVDAKLETTESIEAGLALCDLDENIIILNTFNSRLKKIMPQLRQDTSKILFAK